MRENGKVEKNRNFLSQMLCYLSFFLSQCYLILRLPRFEGRGHDAGAKINYEAFLNETFAVDSAAVIFQACLILVSFSVERG